MKTSLRIRLPRRRQLLERNVGLDVQMPGMPIRKRLEKVNRRGTKVVVPSQRKALHNPEEKSFSKNKFVYDEGQDCYYYPEGHKLVYEGKQDGGKKIAYRITDAATCSACTHNGECANSQRGRKIVRLSQEEVQENLERQYEQPESQEIYARLKTLVEHPFGHIKRNLGMTNFLLRGREGAQAEISIAATCFNLVRMITLIGMLKSSWDSSLHYKAKSCTKRFSPVRLL